MFAIQPGLMMNRASRIGAICGAFVAAVLWLPPRWLVVFALLLVVMAVGLTVFQCARLLVRQWKESTLMPSGQPLRRDVAGALSLAAAAVWLFVGSASLIMMRVYVPYPEFSVYHVDGFTAHGIWSRIVLAGGALATFGLTLQRQWGRPR